MTRLKILLASNLIYICILIILLIYIIFSVKIMKYDSKYNINTAFIEGTIYNYEINEDSLKLYVETTLNEKIIINYYENDFNKYYNLYGKKIEANGKIKELINNTVPNTFNYKKYLYNNKIYYTFTAESIFIKENNNFYYNLKNNIVNYIKTFKSSNYLYTFILGNKTYLEGDIYQVYQDNGIAHILAISGLHISIYIFIFEYILKKVNKNITNTIIIVFLISYLLITNILVSVLRCLIYFILKALNELLQLKLSSIKILIISAILILFYNPFYIYDIAFLYSFIITFFIICLPKKNIFNISLISFLASLPITAYINYEINIMSIILNIIFVPIITFLIYPLSLFTIIFKFTDNLLFWILNIFEWLNNISLEYLKFNILIPKVNQSIYYIYYIFLYLYLKLNYKYLFFCLTIIIFIKTINLIDSNYYIYYIDIGQGDSTLLISPYKKEVVLIDTGGNIFNDVTTNTIKLLKSLGIPKIDLLILTHGDYDHAFGALSLIENIEIKSVMYNNNEFNDLEKQIKNYNIPTEYNLKYFNFNNLNQNISTDENDSSLFFQLYIHNYSFIFPGDITIGNTINILNKNNIECDFLKISHHGSNLSTNKYIIDKLNPSYALISAGRNNIYNHPHKEVLDALKNVKTYVTSSSGTILIKINKNMYNIFEYKP